MLIGKLQDEVDALWCQNEDLIWKLDQKEANNGYSSLVRHKGTDVDQSEAIILNLNIPVEDLNDQEQQSHFGLHHG
jgi:hypothetical protein